MYRHHEDALTNFDLKLASVVPLMEDALGYLRHFFPVPFSWILAFFSTVAATPEVFLGSPLSFFPELAVF